MASKKRSRFAKSFCAEASRTTIDFVDHDDYMSPLNVEMSNPKNATIGDTTKNDRMRKPRITELMKESVDRGLQEPIDSGNRGFKLLAKFGYSSGQGLGKDEAGIVAPVAMNRRNMCDVSGLGLETLKKEKEAMIKKRRQEKAKRGDEAESSFLVIQRDNHKDKKLRSDIHSIQNSLYDLDVRNGIIDNELWSPALRPNREPALDSEIDGTDEGNVSPTDEPTALTTEELQVVLKRCITYSRSNYFYCHYCGVQYNDVEDLSTNCPGDTEDDH